MACATLKRSQAFDLLDAVTPKRRKYGSACSQTVSSPVVQSSSPFVPNAPLTQVQLKSRIKDEIKRLQRRRLIPKFLGSQRTNTACEFGNHLQEKDNAAIASCSGSLRSMALRSPPPDFPDSDSDHSPPHNSLENIPKATPTTATAVTKIVEASHVQLPRARLLDSVPIFTLPQVTALCDRLVKERETELREEYDNILSCKLSEQYEAFLKFHHDQTYNRFQNVPLSYVS